MGLVWPSELPRVPNFRWCICPSRAIIAITCTTTFFFNVGNFCAIEAFASNFKIWTKKNGNQNMNKWKVAIFLDRVGTAVFWSSRIHKLPKSSRQRPHLKKLAFLKNNFLQIKSRFTLSIPRKTISLRPETFLKVVCKICRKRLPRTLYSARNDRILVRIERSAFLWM